MYFALHKTVSNCNSELIYIIFIINYMINQNKYKTLLLHYKSESGGNGAS